MRIKGLKIPAIIFAVGLLLSLVACLLTNVVLTPKITEADFHYSVTYRLNGETKTLHGIYRCRLDGYRKGGSPRDRYYIGEYIQNGQVTSSQTNVIAEKDDGAKLYIVTIFNECYLMGDTKDEDYTPYPEEPYLEALTAEGYAYGDGEMPSEFAAEIISWEYPQPLANTYVFGGFSILHTGSMLAMLLVGVLVMLACILFIKKDEAAPQKGLDKIGAVFNGVISAVAIPFITVAAALLQLTLKTDGFLYQLYLCLPAFTAFTVGASIALRRIGFSRTAFFLQFAGPAVFLLPVFIDSLINNIFG